MKEIIEIIEKEFSKRQSYMDKGMSLIGAMITIKEQLIKTLSELAALEAEEEEHEPTYQEISNEHMRLLEEQSQESKKDCANCPSNQFYLANTERIMNEEEQKAKNMEIINNMANQDALLRDMEEPQGAELPPVEGKGPAYKHNIGSTTDFKVQSQGKEKIICKHCGKDKYLNETTPDNGLCTCPSEAGHPKDGAEGEICPYCGKTEPCNTNQPPEGCFHPNAYKNITAEKLLLKHNNLQTAYSAKDKNGRLRPVIDIDGALKAMEEYAKQFQPVEQPSDVIDIIKCIINFDDSESFVKKGKYFEIIQRDLKKLDSFFESSQKRMPSAEEVNNKACHIYANSSNPDDKIEAFIDCYRWVINFIKNK